MGPFDFADPPSQPAAGRRGRRPWAWAAGGAVLLALALLGVYLTILRPEPVPDPALATPPPEVISLPRPERPRPAPSSPPPRPAPEPVAEPPAKRDWRQAYQNALTRIPEQLPAVDFADLDPASTHTPFVEPKRDPRTGFVVGGRNDTAVVRALTELNGRPIPELEADLRPESPNETPHRSASGFLTADQRLLDVLAADNEYVVGTLGLTHQDLARPLKAMYAAGYWLQTRRPDGWPRPWDEWIALHTRLRQGDGPAFRYKGRRFRVVWITFMGDQDSPFLDGTQASSDVTLVNLETGKKLHYSLLVPEMVERYGFYEGPGTRYRVEPRDIVAVLDFLSLKPR